MSAFIARRIGSALLLASLCGCAAPVPNLTREVYVAPVDVLQVRWTRHLTEDNAILPFSRIEYKPQEFASAASDGARVFIGSSSRSFWAFSARDGRVVWRHELGGAVAGRPLYVDETGLVYVGCDDGGLYAFEAQSGKQRWVYRTHGPIASLPVYSDGALYFTSGENRIYALDARTGAWRWQYDRESPDSFTIRGYPAPLVWNGRIYVGFSDGYLGCLQAGTGEVIWARSLAGEATRFMDVDSTPLFHRGLIFVSDYATGVYALEPKDGSTRWHYEIEGAGSVVARGPRVYFTAAKQGLHALDIDGHLLWRQALSQAGELSEPALVDRYVMVSAAAGGTYIADAVTGRLYQFFFPGHGVTAAPASDGEQVYVLSNAGYFYALGLRRM